MFSVVIFIPHYNYLNQSYIPTIIGFLYFLSFLSVFVFLFKIMSHFQSFRGLGREFGEGTGYASGGHHHQPFNRAGRNRRNPNFRNLTVGDDYPHAWRFPRTGAVLNVNPDCTSDTRIFWHKSVLGYFIDSRTFSEDKVKSLMVKYWASRAPVRVYKMGKVYAFHCESHDDQEDLIDRGFVSMDGGLMVLNRWHPDTVPGTMRFPYVCMWVRVCGLPCEFLCMNVGHIVGQIISDQYYVEEFEVVPRSDYLRIKARLCVNEPLIPGFFLKGSNGSLRWIQFKYEEIFKYCVRCGKVGHTGMDCRESVREVIEVINNRLRKVEGKGFVICKSEGNHTMFNLDLRALPSTTRFVHTRIRLGCSDRVRTPGDDLLEMIVDYDLGIIPGGRVYPGMGFTVTSAPFEAVINFGLGVIPPAVDAYGRSLDDPYAAMDGQRVREYPMDHDWEYQAEIRNRVETDEDVNALVDYNNGFNHFIDPPHNLPFIFHEPPLEEDYLMDFDSDDGIPAPMEVPPRVDGPANVGNGVWFSDTEPNSPMYAYSPAIRDESEPEMESSGLSPIGPLEANFSLNSSPVLTGHAEDDDVFEEAAATFSEDEDDTLLNNYEANVNGLGGEYAAQPRFEVKGAGGRGKSLIPLITSKGYGGSKTRNCASDSAVGFIMGGGNTSGCMGYPSLRTGKRKADSEGGQAAVPQNALDSVDNARLFLGASCKKMKTIKPGFRMGISDKEIIVIDSDDEGGSSTGSTSRFAGVDPQPPLLA